MSSREQFEQSIKAFFGDSVDYRICENSDGDYMAWDMQVAWMAWQAASKASEQQLAAVVAENAGLKAFGDKLYSMYKGLETSGGGFHDEQSIPYQQAALDAAMSAFDEIETPATDAAIASIQAQGVEMFAERKKNEMMSLHPDTHAVGSIAAAMSAEVKELREFAAQLRQGAKS